MYDPGIELVQHVTHITHSLDELRVLNEVTVEALNCSAGERHRGDGNQLRDFRQHRIRKNLNSSEPKRPIDAEQVSRLAMLLFESWTQRNWIADHDRGAAIPLPSA